MTCGHHPQEFRFSVHGQRHLASMTGIGSLELDLCSMLHITLEYNALTWTGWRTKDAVSMKEVEETDDRRICIAMATVPFLNF